MKGKATITIRFHAETSGPQVLEVEDAEVIMRRRARPVADAAIADQVWAEYTPGDAYVVIHGWLADSK